MGNFPLARNFGGDGKCSVLFWVVVTRGGGTFGKTYQAEHLRWVHFIDVSTPIKIIQIIKKKKEEKYSAMVSVANQRALGSGAGDTWSGQDLRMANLPHPDQLLGGVAKFISRS